MNDTPGEARHTRGLLLVALNDALDQLTPTEAGILGMILDDANQRQAPSSPRSTLAVMQVVVELLRHRAQLGIDEVIDRVRTGREFLGIISASYDEDQAEDGGEGESSPPGSAH